MKKLKLRIETLKVESFDAVEEPAMRGTVHANGYPWTSEDLGSCQCPSPGRTAPETCAYTCWLVDTCEPDVCF